MRLPMKEVKQIPNRVTLDFETGRITWDTDTQKGTEICSDLAERRPAILAAMGYETVDFSPAIKAINAFVNGKISEEEFIKQCDEFCEE